MCYLAGRKMNARIGRYLMGYNLIELAGWSSCLIFLSFDYGLALMGITIFQVISILEIFHALKKWNNSSPLFCFVQIAARLMILYISWQLSFDSLFHPLVYFYKVMYIMFAAWCTSEIIRYTYYLSLLFKIKNARISWLRYTAFIVCYPVGLSCELYILFRLFMHTSFVTLEILIVAIFIAYAIFFPILYLHLFRQRRRKLGGEDVTRGKRLEP